MVSECKDTTFFALFDKNRLKLVEFIIKDGFLNMSYQL